MNIEFVASVAVITADPPASRELYVGTLGLPLEADGTGDYYSSGAIEGSKHFGVWPLTQAADACFGTPEWPSNRRVPQASVEFEVADEAAVAAAEQEFIAGGFDLLHATKVEPWGQTVVRVQDADGTIVGVSYAPWMHAG
jgi:catechol 2,3-dioxygenase-like lactoylglutathione lyase family enzyme